MIPRLLETYFHVSVQQAIQESLAHKKPLLVLVSDPQGTITEWSQSIISNEKLISKCTVGIQLKQASQDFSFFTQVWPVVHVPSIFLINGGLVLDMVDESVDAEEVMDRFTRVIGSESTHESKNLENQEENQQSVTNQQIENIRSEPPKQDSKQSDGSKPVSNTPQLHMNRASTSQTPIPPQSTSSKPSTSKSPSKSALAPETSYQQRIRKRRIQDSEERERILRLAQADREEQRANQYHQCRMSMEQYKPTTSKPRAMSNSQTECRMVIRLFDGSALKNVFEATDTLASVRQWIDENRTDGDEPYSLVQTFPTKKFGPSEENESLRTLNLVPSSTLILKAATNVANAYSGGTGWLNSATQTLADAVYTFLGIGFRPPEPQGEHCLDSSPKRSRSPSSPPQSDSTSRKSERVTYNGNQLSLTDDSDIDATSH